MAGARQSFGSRHGEFPVSIHAVLRIARADTKLYTNAINRIQQRRVLKYVHVQFTCVDQVNMVREEMRSAEDGCHAGPFSIYLPRTGITKF